MFKALALGADAVLIGRPFVTAVYGGGAEGEQELQPQIAPPEKKFGVVTVCAGDGIASVFRDLGVDGVISGGQTMNPSTQDILTAVNQVPAETVFVFPNNKNIIMAAEQVDPLTEKTVIVIPSTTIPQGITAMLSYDPLWRILVLPRPPAPQRREAFYRSVCLQWQHHFGRHCLPRHAGATVCCGYADFGLLLLYV